MALQKIKLKIGTVYQKEPNGIYYFRYQVNGARKAISLKTRNKQQAIKEAEKYVPLLQTLIDRGSIAPVYQRNTQQKLAERILETLKNGAATRVQIATMLNIKPYCGYFNRTILDLLNSKQIVYGEKTDSGRIRLLQLK